MNFRKKLSVVLAIGILAAGAVGVTAEEYIDTVSTENQVTVSISNTEEKNIVGVIVKDDQDPTINSNIYGICETKGDNVTFIMPDFRGDDVNGEYTLYVSGKKVGNFFYAKSDSITDAKSALNGIADSDFELALTSGSGEYFALGAMGFDLSEYAALGANAGAARAMFTATYSDEMTEKETAALFNKAVATVSINNGGLVANGLSSINPEFNEVAYKDADAGLKAWIDEYIGANTPILNTADFDKKYELANILYLLDNARFSDIDGLLTGYETELGLTANADYITYKSLAPAYQTVVHDAMVNAFNITPCKSTQVLTSTLATAVSAARGGGSTGGSGGSSSGGSFSGSSGGSSGNSGTGSFLTQPVVSSNTFNDLSSVAWAEDAIKALAEKEIVSGDGTGAFNPMEFVKREQFVKMIVSATKTATVEATNEFLDVDKNAWYAPYVIGAYKAGLVFGKSDTSFGIGNNISRQDMAVIAYRALGGKELEKKRDFVEFADYESISDYAKEAIKALYEAGIISGKDGNLFDPLGTATRAESAVVIYNLFVR